MLVNLTPHAINIIAETTITIPPSGQVARVTTAKKVVAHIVVENLSVPINTTLLGSIENLPPQQPNTFYIVSLIVAQLARRNDLLVVDETIRNSEGQIIGCKAFAML